MKSSGQKSRKRGIMEDSELLNLLRQAAGHHEDAAARLNDGIGKERDKYLASQSTFAQLMTDLLLTTDEYQTVTIGQAIKDGWLNA